MEQNRKLQNRPEEVGKASFLIVDRSPEPSTKAGELLVSTTSPHRSSRIVLQLFLGLVSIVSLFSLWINFRLGIEDLCQGNSRCEHYFDTFASVRYAPPFQPGRTQQPGLRDRIPKYIIDFAPYVYLHDEEQFWPSDMAAHLLHMTPELGYAPIESNTAKNLTLTNLDQLNAYDNGRHVFLTSDDNVEDRPNWLTSRSNIPSNGSCDEDTVPMKASWDVKEPPEDHGHIGRSKAPAVLIVVEKGNGIVDAFWFFFYSYNLGNIVLNIRWGNHVGDWEHTMIRFQNGKPKLVFFSEHNFGSAYSYDAVEKIGVRPVVYSAIGTHAMYSTPGRQPYILPLGLLHDETSRGVLWDPSLNMHTFSYTPTSNKLHPSQLTPHSPTEWFFFNGHWGDKAYPLADDRQYGLIGEYHYVNGPLGPRFKNLGRQSVCENTRSDACVIKTQLEYGIRVPHVGFGQGEGDDWSDD